MLKKNIYIIYPPGYSGSYINWAISKSEKDLALVTVDDPVNKTENLTHGGIGTSHLHTRIPTHQNLQHHLIWMIYNRPVDKKIYIINSSNDYINFKKPEQVISTISRYDPEGIFINIHDDNNLDNRKYGALNTLLKWPIFFKADQIKEKNYKFDSFNCKDSISARDTFYKYFREIFPYSQPLNLDKLTEQVNWFNEWYAVRNTYNPQEVNSETYIENITSLSIFQISIRDIVSDKFIPWLSTLLSTSDSGDYDINHVVQYHKNYIDSQPNLKWFEEIEKFRKTFYLTDYLKSHSLLQAFVLMELSKHFKAKYNFHNKPLEQIMNEIDLAPPAGIEPTFAL